MTCFALGVERGRRLGVIRVPEPKAGLKTITRRPPEKLRQASSSAGMFRRSVMRPLPPPARYDCITGERQGQGHDQRKACLQKPAD
ncbi:hypothetical protein AAFF_G00220570 [Aldrovandia affinis]|uniref:Uncharacterized protein n=1 Tax=Aldrovandia affinis TaxID=143900 RepID=A0AAD7RFQ7_9TELE|nr:hypothetical protein AAFF_G00220570 [Aldrovandia affinis]